MCAKITNLTENFSLKIKKDGKRAAEQFAEASAHDPSSAEALVRFAEVNWRHGNNIDIASDYFDKALVAAEERQSRASGDVFNRAGAFAEWQGKLVRAEELYRKAVQVSCVCFARVV